MYEWNNYEHQRADEPPQPQTRITAAYQANGLTDEIIVPGLKALILGFFGGILGGIIMAWLHGRGWLMEIHAGVTGLVIGLGLLLYWFFKFSERGHYLIERITGVDLNLDGYIGEPMVLPAPTARIELVRNGGNAVDYIDIPHYQGLKQLAPGLLEGYRTFSLEGVTPFLNRKQFIEVRTELLNRRILRWKNAHAPAQGVEFTKPGRALLKTLAGLPDQPTGPREIRQFEIGPGEDPEDE